MLKEQISNDLKAAMKSGQELTVSVLRMISAGIQNKEIELRAKPAGAGGQKEISDEGVQQILSSEMKRRKEAAEAYKKGGRQDLAEKELQEAEIIKKYLPEQMGEVAIAKIIDKQLAAAPTKEFGPIMKGVMAELKGKADAGLISRLLKEKLGS